MKLIILHQTPPPLLPPDHDEQVCLHHCNNTHVHTHQYKYTVFWSIFKQHQKRDVKFCKWEESQNTPESETKTTYSFFKKSLKILSKFSQQL
jgi:hypothetical protein